VRHPVKLLVAVPESLTQTKGYNMRNPAGLIILIVGVVLLVFGFIATDSISSSFSKFFTGSPSNKAIWLIIVGAIVTAGGGIMMARGSSSSL
jgi:hypothetical protein